jgi:predicted CoA-binding protein
MANPFDILPVIVARIDSIKMEKKKTLVLGASDNPARYSNMAIRMLRSHGHEVAAIGAKDTRVDDVEVTKEKSMFEDIHTVTLYLNPTLQQPYYDYILSLKPRRIIYNPGTENPELREMAERQGIENMEACTLVLLSTSQY